MLNAGRIKREAPDKAELDNLRSIVKLRLSDLVAIGLSAEQQFIIHDADPSMA